MRERAEAAEQALRSKEETNRALGTKNSELLQALAECRQEVERLTALKSVLTHDFNAMLVSDSKGNRDTRIIPHSMAGVKMTTPPEPLGEEERVRVLLNSYKQDPLFPFTQEEAHLLADTLFSTDALLQEARRERDVAKAILHERVKEVADDAFHRAVARAEAAEQALQDTQEKLTRALDKVGELLNERDALQECRRAALEPEPEANSGPSALFPGHKGTDLP